MINGLTKEFDRVEVRSRAELRTWLAAHADQPTPVWLVTYKKVRPEWYVSTDEIVDEVLCFGWIDSRVARLDDERTMLMISPRRPGSGCSKVNKDKIERLTQCGQMTPRGLAVIAAAQADGSWTKLDAVETLEEPADLLGALQRNPTAHQYWLAFPKSARRGILEWIANAKTPTTRARRIEETVRLAEENIRATTPRKT
jgi:uncharacterized protein YdeI (YjbR/CyaY-like superfamily)